MIKYIEKDFNKEVEECQNCIVDFYADWCPPCQKLSKVLEEIEKEINIDILKLNTDNNEQIAVEYDIDAIPVLIFFKDGKVEDKILGYVEKEEIINKIQKIYGKEYLN